MTDFNEYTKRELLEIARDVDLEGRTSLDKEQLAEALEAYERAFGTPDSEVIRSAVETQENGSESVTEGITEDTEPTVNDLAGIPEETASPNQPTDGSDGPPPPADVDKKADWLKDMEAYTKRVFSQG